VASRSCSSAALEHEYFRIKERSPGDAVHSMPLIEVGQPSKELVRESRFEAL
jgi:hypothetical protein